jgi:hypothetical protein
MEFLSAAHPAAPLAEYAPALERMIRSGYLRQGFAEVQVNANVEADKSRVRVTINEGRRFKTGQIRFIGVKGRNDAQLEKRLRDALTSPGASVIRGSTLTLGKVLWKKEDYAPFDEGATAEMKERILAELAELNYYKLTPAQLEQADREHAKSQNGLTR